MKPEFNSRRYFGITRSKGKMYEFGLPEESHIAVPAEVEPAALFPLSIGTLVDASAALNDAADLHEGLAEDLRDDIDFAASFFDAYLNSRFDTDVSREVTLLASASYFLGQRPGSSLVLARRLKTESTNAIEQLTVWALQADWAHPPRLTTHWLNELLNWLMRRLIDHFTAGGSTVEVEFLLRELRRFTYQRGTSREVVLAEIASAVVKLRLAGSAWTLLPSFSGLNSAAWTESIRRPGFPKELWPSQKLLGKAGLFAGKSGVVQMPTSAGKTRSVEVILRSAFLADRTRVVVLVAPFRALCQEIATSLRRAFKGEEVKVNEISDAIQLDFVTQLAELLGEATPTTRHLMVLTPEKLLYVLRQAPSLVKHIGCVVYDEGHQFDTGARGVTYELLLTEIKELLPASAQILLISAVIKNAVAIGTWLIGTEPNVVDGTGLLSTARSVAFATWQDKLGQLDFYESGNYARPDYFVPRSIETQNLELRGKEWKAREFPEKGDDAWKDISLYLGIRLAPNGAVAIFCGLKATASGLAERAVEVYERGFRLPPPAAVSDPAEVKRLVYLASKHFGADSALARAAALGVFVHHRTIPQGLRLSIEHAMQSELIKLVVCTSTLAQGVNLPIRYLIVSGTSQGREKIKTRDFQNLIGRAGRAGMHTEGIVLFADPKITDRRRTEPKRMRDAVGLLQPLNSEETTSSLLSLLDPFPSSEWVNTGHFPTDKVFDAYFLSGEALKTWAIVACDAYPNMSLEAKTLVELIRSRQLKLRALESYLMANRGTEDYEEFVLRVQTLASSTLAYSLAEESLRPALIHFFTRVAEHINRVEAEPARQAMYAKTLLGVEDAARVERWVQQNAYWLTKLSSSDEWLQAIWPLLLTTVRNEHLTAMKPDGFSLQLAQVWVRGAPYREIIALASDTNATKPWGDNKRHNLSESDIIEFLEGCLGFECQLVVAAAGQLLFGTDGLTKEFSDSLNIFQKSLKYGLPTRLAISAYESGLADRCLAQEVATQIELAGYEGVQFRPALDGYRDVVVRVLDAYPVYFSVVLDGL